MSIVFRLALLVIVSFLGALAYCARHERDPAKLVRLALRKCVVVTLWVVGPFFLMLLIERMWIDP